jgi:hypothetical protein
MRRNLVYAEVTVSSARTAQHARTGITSRVIRLLPWLSALVLVAGVVAFVIVRAGQNPDTNAGAAPANGAPVKVTNEQYVNPRDVDPRVMVTARQFLKTAVDRSNAVRAYQLSGPELRQGLTLKQWVHDWNDPNVGVAVVPYPLAKVKASPFRVDWATKKQVMLEVALLPKPGAGIRSQLFYMRIDKAGVGSAARWIVGYWVPRVNPPVPITQ